jgi:hypothetical protein
VACAALCTLARERPGLLAPAILAAGLSVGTKTTTLPLAAVVLVLGLHGARGGLRDLRGPLLAGIAGALAVGGVWYLRNLVDHGSPFWPLAAAPWGDRVPDAFAFVKTSFLERPRVTIDSLGHDYVHRFGGGLALLAGGVMAPLISPRRRVLAAAAATAVAFLIWTDAPATGISPNGISTIEETVFSTTRYLLPVVAAGALALALAANGQRRSWAAAAILLGALVLNLVQTFDLGFPVAPPPAVALGGAAVGGLLAVPVRVLPDLHRSPWVLPLGAVAAAALLAIPASGYVQRHGRVSQLFSSSAVRWLAAESRFRDGDDPVAISPAPIAALAGDDLDHRQEVIRRGAQCESIPARAVSHWLVIYGGTGGQAIPASVGRCLPRRRPAFTGRSLVIYRPEGRRRSSSRVTDTAASSTIVISAGARKRGRP